MHHITRRTHVQPIARDVARSEAEGMSAGTRPASMLTMNVDKFSSISGYDDSESQSVPEAAAVRDRASEGREVFRE